MVPHTLQFYIDLLMIHIKDPQFAASCADVASSAYTAGYKDALAKKPPQNDLFVMIKNDPRRKTTPEQITNEVRRIFMKVREPK